MRSARFRECLAADAERLREVVAGHAAAPVPTCPGWTVTEPAGHLTMVYRHKTEIALAGVLHELMAGATQ